MEQAGTSAVAPSISSALEWLSGCVSEKPNLRLQVQATSCNMMVASCACTCFKARLWYLFKLPSLLMMPWCISHFAICSAPICHSDLAAWVS